MIMILLMGIAATAIAQGTPRLSIVIEDEKHNLTAEERSGQADILYHPGDTIRYVLTASNVGDGLMTDPEIIDPIPGGVTYIAGSAEGVDTRISYSIDGGSTYHAWPVMYSSTNARGEEITKEATPDMVTHLKWGIQRSLQPGEATTMEFRVEVNR